MSPAVEAAPTALDPAFFRPVALPPASPARLFVVVDTEEEFNWSAPFSREAVGVTAISEVGRLQDVLERFACRPTYVIDYPVAATPSSSERLAALAKQRRCQIGAHLHPWVSPPFTEKVGHRNSYACNLGIDLEREKVRRLRDTIEERLGVRARSYKAGRYGFARTTAEVLEDVGFDVDLSVNPEMDFRGDGGPSFAGFSPQPGWFGTTRRLLELPCTHAYVGAARRMGASIHRRASAPWLRQVRAVGLLAKTGLVNKVMLSPEGNTLAEMKALTRALYADGLRTFALTFHSPSLMPGCTPYVHTAVERDAFVDRIDGYCDFFFGQFGGMPSTPEDFYDELQRTGDSMS